MEDRVLYIFDRRIQVEETAKTLGISHVCVSTVLHDRLGMHKLTVCRVVKIDHEMFSMAILPLLLIQEG